jgi:hypothetical protein
MKANRPAPWAVSDAPREYIDTMLKAIVGFSPAHQPPDQANASSAKTAALPIRLACATACWPVTTRTTTPSLN